LYVFCSMKYKLSIPFNRVQHFSGISSAFY
jgi:hypothetical protein